MRHYFHRHQPPHKPHTAALAGLGAMIAIGVTGALSFHAGAPLLIAPFGASSVLLFSVPNSPLSQPANVVGGHLVATGVAIALHMVLPGTWWAAAIAVGAAIALMALLRLIHPPAGADPLLVFASDPSWAFLVMPVGMGAVALVAIAALFHRSTGTTYPLKAP
ncbi:HPP family protein [Ancylobacter dichloromethanicus]|uniref:Membrane protein n=1 Tax=Ancylobacter dichloromethanicus TaxID=518825 RepID=A0A9W6JCI2_9HYPH|nr:HPP family protein [Ancylobacter dichloromethanicus]MBS7553320.1 HPP family protein [Ancylobacter dichloromethanicus]GLK73103.1 membrane protein [Ancylobacter dichloromethanicus]